MRTLLHLCLSSSLVFTGEYSTVLFLQIVYLLSLYKRYVYFFYMPILHFSLVKLFASAYYTLYFLNLGVALFWLYKDKMEFGNKDIVIFLILMGLVYFLSIHAQTMIYDIYIYFDFTDEAYYTDPLTAHILIFLHLFLFLWTKEKKNLYFKNY